MEHKRHSLQLYKQQIPPFLRYSLAVLLFLAISAQGQEINVNYDDASSKLKVFEIKNPLVLHCQVTGKHELEWKKNGVDVKVDSSLTGRYSILPTENKFIINKAHEGDAGNYTCTVKGTSSSASIRVIAAVASKLPSNSAVIEEEKLTLHCIVVGTDPEIKWTIHDNITIEESFQRYVLKEDENKIKNAVLVINEVQLSDRGNYTCEVMNEATLKLDKYSPIMSTSYVRVKGKFAALWPFLGICAEVFILCAIILIYEKRRNKAELDESDTDQSPEQKKKRISKNYD